MYDATKKAEKKPHPSERHPATIVPSKPGRLLPSARLESIHHPIPNPLPPRPPKTPQYSVRPRKERGPRTSHHSAETAPPAHPVSAALTRSRPTRPTIAAGGGPRHALRDTPPPREPGAAPSWPAGYCRAETSGHDSDALLTRSAGLTWHVVSRLAQSQPNTHRQQAHSSQIGNHHRNMCIDSPGRRITLKPLKGIKAFEMASASNFQWLNLFIFRCCK